MFEGIDPKLGRTGEICLRPYQTEAVRQAQEHIAAGAKKLLLVAPTGSGKTSLAGHLITEAAKQGQHTIFIAHRRELINQAYRRFLEFGIPESDLGVIMASDPRRNPRALVQVASIDTLRHRTKPGADLVFVDEAHRATARSYRNIASCYPDAVHLGLTATPFRANGEGLKDAYDELVVVTTPKALIEQGYLVEPRVFTVAESNLPDLSSVRIKRGDYDESALARAMDRPQLVGNMIEHWKKHAPGVRTVAFATSVAHSKHITEQFLEAGIPAEHLDGTTPTKERDSILGRLESGVTQVVSNCGVLCLDAWTEILCDTGWKTIDTLSDVDLVAGWSERRIQFKRPLAIHRRDRLPGERMVSAQGRSFSLRVTEGHGIVYRTSADSPWEKAPARDLVGQDIELPACGNAEEPLPLQDAPQIRDVLQQIYLNRDHVPFGAENFPRGFTLCNESRSVLERCQAVAACTGYLTWLHSCEGHGEWLLTLLKQEYFSRGTARMQFEDEEMAERVWCVTTRAGNIVTRRNGCVVVLGNCEGWDQPSVKCAILARPTKSTGLYLQQAGRILRPYLGQQAIILDHAGCAMEHGLPQDDREFTLEGKKAKGKEEKGDVPLKVCPNCHAVLQIAISVCPTCGHTFAPAREDPEEVSGSLVEVPSNLLQRQIQDYHRFLQAAEKRGYKPGWAYYQFRERYGCNPPRVIREARNDLQKVDQLLRTFVRTGRGKVDWSSFDNNNSGSLAGQG